MNANEWGITAAFKTRAEINDECDKKNESAREHIDIVAFGLTSLRESKANVIENALGRGAKIRILSMDPESNFLKERQEEEGGTQDIGQQIRGLQQWVDDLAEKYPGKIELRFYRCMTLDFYWRVDDTIYFGPYWNGIQSQRTVTYKIDKPGNGFDAYQEYFDQLWERFDPEEPARS